MQAFMNEPIMESEEEEETTETKREEKQKKTHVFIHKITGKVVLDLAHSQLPQGQKGNDPYWFEIYFEFCS